MSFSALALGSAFNLSYTIIRETQEDNDRSKHSDESADTMISITGEEELALPVGDHGPREDCSAAGSTTSPQESGRRARAWLDVSDVVPKGGNILCSRSATHAVD